MFMNNPTEYAPLPLTKTSLEPGETHFYTFSALQVEKQLLGYRPQSSHPFLCHITNQRVVFEAQSTDESQFFQVPVEAIATLKLVRTLTLASFAQIVLNTTLPGVSQEQLIFAIGTPRQLGSKVDRAGDFVALCKELLGQGTGSMSLFPFQPNPQAMERFRLRIASSDVPVVVDFWSMSCEPCRIFEPIIDAAIQPFDSQAQLVKVNIDNDPYIAMEYGVDCFPTLLIFKQGQIVERIVGSIPQVLLTKVFYKHLGQPLAISQSATP